MCYPSGVIIHLQKLKDMQALKKLGISSDKDIPARILFGENFNPGLYGFSSKEAEKIKALREVIADYNKSLNETVKVIKNSFDAVSYLAGSISNLQHEEVWILFLNNSNNVLADEMMFKGGLGSTPIDIRTVIAKALNMSASGIILYHNHPSGNPQPSKADCEITASLRESLNVFDIRLMDHIILCPGKFYSFSEGYEKPYEQVNP